MPDSRVKVMEQGFTLVELMAVIAVITILIVIAVPVYRDVSASSREKADAANIRIIESSIQTYLANNSGEYNNLTMDADGDVAGTGVTPGNLVPKYLVSMPRYPYDDTKSYTKAPNEKVIPQ